MEILKQLEYLSAFQTELEFGHLESQLLKTDNE